MNEPVLMILAMALITYLIRALPLMLLRQKIPHPFLLSFLHYVPYVTLSIMIFPDVLFSTGSWVSAALGFALMLWMAYSRKNMFLIALASCLVVFVAESLI